MEIMDNVLISSPKTISSSKGIASTIELIGVMIAVFVSFNVFFPGSSYKNNWEDAYAMLISRDMLASLVATGDLHVYMADDASMQDFFSSLFPESNYVFLYRTEGIKDSIKVACACSDGQISTLQGWADSIEMNGREIGMLFCKADLSDPDNACIKESDALLVWNGATLDRDMIYNYLIEDKGVIDIRDFASEPGAVHREIFGISGGGTGASAEDTTFEPSTTQQITYQPYKMFYHMPLALSATGASTVPSECEASNRGSLKVREAQYSFWICNESSVYMDSNRDGNPDTGPLLPGSAFTLDGFDFKLAYVDSGDSIMVVFTDLNQYRFRDFTDAGGVGVLPDDGDQSRVFLRMTGDTTLPCGVVLNNISDSRTAWVSDFGRDGLDAPEVGDDHRQMILSLLVWASKKQEGSEYVGVERGYATSYVSVNNTDIFEIDRYEIAVGYPY